jgi:hypothetical protein
MNSIRTLENSLYWQNHVLTHSKEQKQKERAKLAIIKLQNELNRARATK